MDYHFPGNIRELKNIIEHAVIKSGGGVIQPEHLPWIGVNEFSPAHAVPLEIPTALTFDGKPPSLPELINECERALILDALSRTKDQKAAAAQLGIPESTLRHKMDHHHIQRKRFEPIRQKLE
ncbi:hypothetical protein HYR99_41175 [Candidatus Poribacteria bacterium]|nr:hypothetical protein [Candidatus Poribacteria bacterium]